MNLNSPKQLPNKKVEYFGCDEKKLELYFSDAKWAKECLEPRHRTSSFTEKIGLASPKESSDIKNILRRLLYRRSSREILEKKGIIQNEPVFGNTLCELQKSSGLLVPSIVEKLIDLVETPENIRTEGIYRTSGNLAIIQKVRFEVDKNNYQILVDYSRDVDVLAGTLKLFFRELKKPLISTDIYHELVEVGKYAIILKKKTDPKTQSRSRKANDPTVPKNANNRQHPEQNGTDVPENNRSFIQASGEGGQSRRRQSNEPAQLVHRLGPLRQFCGQRRKKPKPRIAGAPGTRRDRDAPDALLPKIPADIRESIVSTQICYRFRFVSLSLIAFYCCCYLVCRINVYLLIVQ